MQDILDRIDGMEAQIWLEPSRGQRFWLRHAPRMFAPDPVGAGAFVRWWAIATVTPSTNITGLNVPYQAYLDAVFHRTWLARIGHAVFMPIIVASTLAALFPVRVGPFNLAEAATILIAIWWATWARIWRDALWGACTVAVIVVLYALAAEVMTHRPPAHGLAAVAWSPLLWAPLAALLQASSHAREPLPPRVTRSHDWIPVDVYLLGRPGARNDLRTIVRRTGHLTAQSFFGAGGELFSATRLLPVLLLRLLWQLGHDATRRNAELELVRRAVESGNPALDYVGIGGATPLRNM